MSNLLLLLKNKAKDGGTGRISAVLFSSDSSPEVLFETYKKHNLSVTISQSEEFTEAYLRMGPEEQSDLESKCHLEGRFYFAPIFEGIWVAITDMDDKFIEAGLLKLLRKYSPHIARLGFTSAEIRDILLEFIKTSGLEADVKKAITYPYGGNAAIDYDPRNLVDLFDFCSTERRYLDKARVRFYRSSMLCSDAFISRDGIFRFYDGDIDFFYRKFLRAFAGSAKETKQILEKRERVMGDLQTHPLEVQFNYDVFKEPGDNERFVKALSSMAKSGVAVYHRNPYLHVSFVDFQDGSTYDIFAVSPKLVYIIPSFRASVDSLSRITSHMFESISEGTLKDWTQQKMTMQEYFE